MGCPYCPIRFWLFETKEKHIAAVHPELLQPVQPRTNHSVMETHENNGDKRKASNQTDLAVNVDIATLPESSEQSSATRRHIGINTEGQGTAATEKIRSFQCFMCPVHKRNSDDLQKHLSEEHKISDSVSSALISSFYQPFKNQNNRVTMKIEPDDEIIFLGEFRHCHIDEMRCDANGLGEGVDLLSQDFSVESLNQWQQRDENMYVTDSRFIN